MSIHVKLDPVAEARLAAQRRNSTISSLVISLLVIVIIGLALGLVLLPSLARESPVIVSYKGIEQQEKEPEKKKVTTNVRRKPTSPASSSVRVIASTSSSPVSIPVPDEVVPVESVDFGDGEDFGGGWGDGDGFGGGGGASFFNQSVKANRIAYVIDYSKSMKGEKDKLMRAELTKSVSGLAPGTKFQMIFFSGPAWIAGDDASANRGTGVVKDSGGHKFEWVGKGAHVWKTKGKRQTAEWLDVTVKQLEESLKVIKNSKLVYGTDWTNPLEMAFEMDPPPEIIFFMTDGQMSGRDMVGLSKDLASQAKSKKIVVNSIAMMEPRAEESMFELAKRTGGVFTVVEKGGKSREVKRVKRK
ncbi:MAG: hypothetical protein OSA84_06090 [Akkermansiaceae bacterium]|nr:hypothetical protein [Akkermansiaceae bacterium]